MAGRSLAIGDIVRTRIVCDDDNQVSENIMHWNVFALGTPAATDNDFATAFDSIIAPLFKAILPGDTNYIGVGVQVLFPLPVLVEQTNRSNVGAGTFGGTSCPKQCAALISWHTLFAGPANRGRTYLPFIPATALTTNGELVAAYNTARTTLAVAIAGFHSIVVAGRGASVNLCIKHRGAFATTDIVGFSTSVKVATQKKRSDYNRTNSVPF
jgi:hypothetical protein